jgi:hypothetical protein
VIRSICEKAGLAAIAVNGEGARRSAQQIVVVLVLVLERSVYAEAMF